VYTFMLLIRCVQIDICILLAFMKLVCQFLFVFVWRHYNGRRKRLASNFFNFAGISPTAKWIAQYEIMSCNITIYHKKNESYGCIKLNKTINVIICNMATAILTKLIEGRVQSWSNLADLCVGEACYGLSARKCSVNLGYQQQWL
jgi:hypothetical protein